LWNENAFGKRHNPQKGRMHFGSIPLEKCFFVLQHFSKLKFIITRGRK
jgi:hypothetical protein